MILPNPNDAVHKAMMYRCLMAILDQKFLAMSLYFKGGTAASMLGFLDRFSIDLDFDLKREASKKAVRETLVALFHKTGFSIHQQARSELFFVLKYQTLGQERNTLKVSVVDLPPRANIYKPFYLSDITRYALCQTKETMVANKLVAPVDRYQKYHTITGRDMYDIHHFFLKGYGYNQEVIKERTKKEPKTYLKELVGFIEQRVTEKHLSEDLNVLLPPDKLYILKSLKMETINLLRDEIERISTDKP